MNPNKISILIRSFISLILLIPLEMEGQALKLSFSPLGDGFGVVEGVRVDVALFAVNPHSDPIKVKRKVL